MPDPTADPRHVFVYGTLRRGERNDIAHFLPRPDYVGQGRLRGLLYDLGAYPGAVLGGETWIEGEIYRITGEVEAALDVLEEVAPDGSGEYLKREVPVESQGRMLICLVYEIHPERVALKPVIACGDWRERRGPIS
ncbi:MAG: gamma-glutamylcyclotransferase [Gammaproteobacteria bacterium]|nr:gamma-glutamylcyclotransferase [Gammaproteobacteria bacterium]MBU1442490.1 gamma-glutamylcyclotransferase [Gammaproteobacteria bacterium]MBU2410637.1 gamma-glutamylcyclotransferase [Gammaproteobacteria bacterium]